MAPWTRNEERNLDLLSRKFHHCPLQSQDTIFTESVATPQDIGHVLNYVEGFPTYWAFQPFVSAGIRADLIIWAFCRSLTWLFGAYFQSNACKGIWCKTPHHERWPNLQCKGSNHCSHCPKQKHFPMNLGISIFSSLVDYQALSSFISIKIYKK